MIEFKSKLDSSKTAALAKNSFKKYLILFGVASLFFIALGVTAIVLLDEEGDIARGVFLIAVGVLFTPIAWLVTKLSQKSMDKSSSFISSDTEEIYTFDDDYITITQNRGDEFTSYTKAKYSYIYQACENKDYYFLYISKIQCHVIDKSSLTQGSLEEMNTLLRVQLGDRFKRKK